MKKVLVIILLSMLGFAGCRKGDSSSGGFDILSTDQKDEAAKIVNEANQDLKRVKEIYRANQKRVDSELIPAITAKDVEKAKEISNDFVIQINSGLVAAEEAVTKIKKAEEMDINDTYKEYLRLKREALEKQIEAFELRRQSAKLLNQSFGSKNPAEIAQAQSLFKEKEIQFDDLMERGKGLSEEANQIYKDSLKKK